MKTRKPGESTKRAADNNLIAIVGDMVGSRMLDGAARRSAQDEYRRLLGRLNKAFAASVRSRFEITLGDEFEGLIESTDSPAVIPEFLWLVEAEFKGPDLRTAFGMGRVDTEIRGSTRELDGPAFHRAREAIQSAKLERKLGGVFLGFGEAHDAILNGIARALHLQRLGWSKQQSIVASHLRAGKNQTAAARAMGLTKQAVSAYTRAAHWRDYAEGERALCFALRCAVTGSQIEDPVERSRI